MSIRIRIDLEMTEKELEKYMATLFLQSLADDEMDPKSLMERFVEVLSSNAVEWFDNVGPEKMKRGSEEQKFGKRKAKELMEWIKGGRKD